MQQQIKMTTTSDCLNTKLFDNIKRLKEDGSNWDVWKMQLTLVLEHQGLMPYVEGSKPHPHPPPPSPSGKSTSGSVSGSGSTSTNQATIDEWDKANWETLIQIVLTLEHKVATLITGKSLTLEAWTAVKSCFDGRCRRDIIPIFSLPLRRRFRPQKPGFHHKTPLLSLIPFLPPQRRLPFPSKMSPLDSPHFHDSNDPAYVRIRPP